MLPVQSLCKCINCQKLKLHNFMVDEKNNVEVVFDPEKAKKSFGNLLGFFYTLTKDIGTFVVGILIGIGIVMRDPPANKELEKNRADLVAENNALKKDKDNLAKTLSDLQRLADNSKKVLPEIKKPDNELVVKNSFNLK